MAATGEPAVEVRDLRVVRGGRTVLDGLDLAVPAGQVVGLLGPSGGGKTTLMRCVVGVQQVAGGEVTVLGRPAGHPDLRRSVGYVTQAPSVYADLTVRENLAYLATVTGAGRRDGAPSGRRGVARAVDEVVEQVDLGDRADARVADLSGGQQTRVSLAGALVGRPRLLVLDEPTVGLDPVLRRDLWDLFGRLAADGVTLLVSSHVMDEAVRCDRLLLLREGALLADDDLPGLLARTGAQDAEQAFLTLVERAGGGRP
ncbi:ABC transporter ATP-binding protein [Thalassiella azotivora]